MSVRLRRLTNDNEELRQYAVDQDRVLIRNTTGEPPERYQIEYRLKGLEMKGGEVVERSSYLVEIVLPLEYPTMEPKCRMLTPVFHPNISPQVICHTDHWAAGESLVDVVVRIGEMISYQNYNIKSPRNGEAARWAESNMSRFPIDPVGLSWVRPQTEGGTPQHSDEMTRASQSGSWPEGETVDENPIPPNMERKSPAADPLGFTCANCGAKGPAASFHECSNRHMACPDCVLICHGCGRRLCVLCSFSQCSSCKAILCEECAIFCPSCGRPFCKAHRVECPACRTATCPDCGHVCPSCQRFLCHTHFPQADDLCADCLGLEKGTGAQAVSNRCSKCGNVIEYWNARFCPCCGTKLH